MQGSLAPLPGLLASARGVVLELGPGTGSMMKHYRTSEIQALYLAEPAVRFHEALEKSALATGLDGKMTILPGGAETQTLIPMLLLSGLEPRETFDTIVSVRSLCSVNEPGRSIQTLYGLLRPGGKIIICEHVVNPWPHKDGNVIGRSVQVLCTAIGWPYFVGNCQLNRDTVTMIKNAARVDGGWGRVELLRETDWASLPWVLGTFVKKAD